jgi:hypothetical protein
MRPSFWVEVSHRNLNRLNAQGLARTRLFLFFSGLASLALLISAPLAQSQSSVRIVGTESTIEPRTLVDFPTAGVLPKSSFASEVEFFQGGGVLASFSIGPISRLTFGLSYGGSNVLGSEKVSLNKTPGVNVKLRVFDERVDFPALALGFDSQGKEPYIDSTKRYTIKSPGFYVVASKNYSFLGYTSIHGGLNYSLERKDGDRDINGFLGLEKTLGPAMALLAEYNLATNDDHGRALGRGRGYLNVGWRWALAEGFVLGIDFKNLTKNQPQQTFANRVLRLEYVRYF